MSTVISPLYQGTVADEDYLNPTKQTGTETGLGQDAFLKMFMAQMTHQNPLDPMDNTEFTAQLAQFSSLEQLTKISESLEGIGRLEETLKQSTVLDYLGKEVTLSGDMLPVSEGYVGTVEYQLENAATSVEVYVTDEDGNSVFHTNLGAVSAGFQEWQWDGKDNYGNAVDDGNYKVSLVAYDSTGTPVDVSEQRVTALVTGYEKGSDGEQYLLLGEAALPLSEVIAVREPIVYYSSSAAASKASSQASDDLGLTDILKGIASLGGLAALL